MRSRARSTWREMGLQTFGGLNMDSSAVTFATAFPRWGLAQPGINRHALPRPTERNNLSWVVVGSDTREGSCFLETYRNRSLALD